MGAIKKILLLCSIALLFTFSYKVTSYTQARVENSMVLAISPSEDSLIGVPEGFDLRVVRYTTITELQTIRDPNPILYNELVTNIQPSNIATIEFTPKGFIEYSSNTTVEFTSEGIIKNTTETKTETMVKENYFYVKNNINEDVDVAIFIDNGHRQEQNQGLYIVNPRFSIWPGKKENIIFNVNETIREGSLDLIISSKWSNGSAEIMKKIDINIEEFEPEFIYENKDLRIVKSPVITETNESIEEVETNEELSLEESIEN